MIMCVVCPLSNHFVYLMHSLPFTCNEMEELGVYELSHFFFYYEKDIVEKEQKKFKTEIAPKTFILALDGDVDFKPDAVLRLLERMLKNPDVGAACGRIIPKGRGNNSSSKL